MCTSMLTFHEKLSDPFYNNRRILLEVLISMKRRANILRETNDLHSNHVDTYADFHKAGKITLTPFDEVSPIAVLKVPG